MYSSVIGGERLLHLLRDADMSSLHYCMQNNINRRIDIDEAGIPFISHDHSAHINGSVSVANILKCKDRESNYYAKKAGQPLFAEQMGFRMDGFLPNCKIPFLLDNCIDSGETAKAAHRTIGNKGFVISYAMSETLLKNQKRQMAFSR